MSNQYDVFGLRAHDERHSETERLLRRLVEQVGQLSIDLGVTRTELRRLALDVAALGESRVRADDIDPAIAEFNERLKDARVRLDETRDSAAEEWARSQKELFAALDDLNTSIDD